MKFSVLDHGYVELIEAWGQGSIERLKNEKLDAIEGLNHSNFDIDHECGIVEAARQSTQGAFRGWHVDRKLLATLFNSKPQHGTPFEFAGMVIEVQAPIMVFREWHRHRTQSYNEMSARYAPLPDLYYEPSLHHILERAHKAAEEKNKQLAGIAPPDDEAIAQWYQRDYELTGELEKHYQAGLAAGVPKELARKKMPVDHYSRMRAAANLRNWCAFLALRLEKGVMYEMRLYAEAVEKCVQQCFPQTWALFKGESNV